MDSLDEWLQQKVGKPLCRYDAVVLLLQLLPSSQIASRDSRDGSGYHGTRLVFRRIIEVKGCRYTFGYRHYCYQFPFFRRPRFPSVATLPLVYEEGLAGVVAFLGLTAVVVGVPLGIALCPTSSVRNSITGACGSC